MWDLFVGGGSGSTTLIKRSMENKIKNRIHEGSWRDFAEGTAYGFVMFITALAIANIAFQLADLV